MSGHHATGGSNWKLWILVGVLVVVIVALAFLCINFLLGDGAPAAPETTLNISAQIAAQDATGKDVTKHLSIAEGTMAPETDDPNAQFMLVDIGWAGKKDPSFPMIITISDHTFTNDDGLAVYHYANGQWTLLGTYLIKNNSVSFQADSFSPFAFQVISSNPVTAPTATPEPTPEITPEPTPEVTPAPTPEPVDYGKYDEEQEGVFIQAKKLAEDKEYVIALIDTENEAEIPDADSVTFFGDDNDDNKVYNATILLHYEEGELRTVKAKVAQTDDGQFYILDPVVEGMLWTTENSDPYGGSTRFSLVNNDKYLNLDNPNENVVLDDDDYRTRWLYEEIDIDGEDTYTLTYRANLGMFYADVMEMTEAEAAEDEEESETEAEEVLTFTATDDTDEALVFYIFAVDTGEVETDVVSGTLVLTSTPAANEGLEATPVPTNTPGNSGGGNLPTPVTPTAAPTTKPTTKPTTVPTAEPTNKPSVTDTPTPTNAPEVTKKPTETNTNNPTPVPEATKKPTGTNTD